MRSDSKLTVGGGGGNLSNSPQIFVCGSAQCTVQRPHPKVGYVKYSGVICHRCLDQLRRQAIEATKDCRVLVLDYSKVLFTMAEFSCATKAEGVTDAPAALIVREEHYDFACGYTEKMEEQSIMRVVFAPSQMQQVWRWVDRLAGAAALREHQSRLGISAA